MKRIVPLTFFLVLTTMHTHTQTSALENHRIQQFDERKIGSLTVGIDGALVHDMLWVIDTINSIQRGTQQHNTSRSIHTYDFAGGHCTLEQLASKEKNADSQCKHLDLRATIERVKNDFGETVSHFMQQLIVKTIICDAIEEWCTKSDREESLLKTWAATNKEEFDAVYHEIESAETLNLFLNDLKDFLTDVIKSCPHAWQDFLEHKEHYAAQTLTKKNAS